MNSLVDAVSDAPFALLSETMRRCERGTTDTIRTEYKYMLRDLLGGLHELAATQRYRPIVDV